jgi:hypothetical protein
VNVSKNHRASLFNEALKPYWMSLILAGSILLDSTFKFTFKYKNFLWLCMEKHLNNIAAREWNLQKCRFNIQKSAERRQ